MVNLSTLFGIVVLLIGLTEVGLFIYFLRYQKTITIKAYLAFIGGVAMWVLANAISQLQGSGDVSFNEKFAYLGGTILTTSFLVFIHAFPYPKSTFINRLKYFPILATGFFGYLLFFTKSFYDQLELKGYFSEWGKASWGLYVWTIFMLMVWILALIELIRRFRDASGDDRKRLKYLLIGVGISAFIGVTTDVIAPLFLNGIILALASASSIIWLWFTVKAVRV